MHGSSYAGLRKLRVYSLKQLHMKTLRRKIYVMDVDWKRVTLMSHICFKVHL